MTGGAPFIRFILLKLGFRIRKKSDARIILDEQLLPMFASRRDLEKVIFIGVQWYTFHYNRLFAKKKYWTVDIDPKRKKYGSKRHIVDSAENLKMHFKTCSVDLIVFNGVFGWGINTRELFIKTVRACKYCLNENGLMLFGWNDLDNYRPFEPVPIILENGFTPFPFSENGCDTIRTPDKNRHIYKMFKCSKTFSN